MAALLLFTGDLLWGVAFPVIFRYNKNQRLKNRFLLIDNLLYKEFLYELLEYPETEITKLYSGKPHLYGQ